jgi:hypothetical protein
MEKTCIQVASKVGIISTISLFISILVFGISLLIKEANMLSYISSIFIAPSFGSAKNHYHFPIKSTTRFYS